MNRPRSSRSWSWISDPDDPQIDVPADHQDSVEASGRYAARVKAGQTSAHERPAPAHEQLGFFRPSFTKRLSFSQLVGVIGAGVHRPPLSPPIDEPAAIGNGLPAMAGMADTAVDKPEALLGLDTECVGVVAHRGDLSGPVSPCPRG